MKEKLCYENRNTKFVEAHNKENKATKTNMRQQKKYAATIEISYNENIDRLQNKITECTV